MTQGSLHLYFDTASMLITLVLLGRYIEIHAGRSSRRDQRTLPAGQPEGPPSGPTEGDLGSSDAD